MYMVATHEQHFSLQRCTLVVGVFGLITIISYFNELAKAGLLYKHVPRRSHSKNDHRILQRNERFDVDLSHVKQVLDDESAHHAGKINIALHIGNNQSYEKINASEVTVYQHSNTLHNYFLAANRTFISDIRGGSLGTTASVNNNTNISERAYVSAVRVFLYQHEWGGYACRDCVKGLAREAGLAFPTSPLNTAFRQEWDKFPARRKQHFSVLYGSLSFGVCEKLLSPCQYFVMMQHPIDRILQVYHHCKDANRSTTEYDNICRFEKLNFTRLSLSQFIRHQGSGLFKKLLYYSRHCKLVGADEVCLKDAAFSFTPHEREIQLSHILDNLHKWFSVVGLVGRYNESMQLLEYVFKQEFTSCPLPEFEEKDASYVELWKRVEQDRVAMKYLRADVAIYNKFEEIFEQQIAIYRKLTRESASTTTSGTSSETPTTQTNKIVTSTPIIPKARGRFFHRNKTEQKSNTTTPCENCPREMPQKERRIKEARKHERNKHTTKAAQTIAQTPKKKNLVELLVD